MLSAVASRHAGRLTSAAKERWNRAEGAALSQREMGSQSLVPSLAPGFSLGAFVFEMGILQRGEDQISPIDD
jgi:hypothetical protein